MNDEEFKEFGDFMAEAAVRQIVLKRIESGVYKIQNSYNNILVIKDDRSAWSVVGVDGRVIVPFKKYGWIDGFQQGLASAAVRRSIVLFTFILFLYSPARLISNPP